VKATSILTLTQAIEIREKRYNCGLNNEIPDLPNNDVLRCRLQYEKNCYSNEKTYNDG
jgi:hypothetical protein